MKNLSNNVIFEQYENFINYAKKKFLNITVGYHPNFPYQKFNFNNITYHVFGYTQLKKSVIIHYIDQFSLDKYDDKKSLANCKSDTMNTLLYYIQTGRYSV